jgi:D-sedoheptulose 7-phosphate isomerase
MDATNPYGIINDALRRRAKLFDACSDSDFEVQIGRAVSLINIAFHFGTKLLIFGNGGSAAEAQHFATELVCQFQKKRKALPAIALTTDSSILTAQANDYGFDHIFSRQIEALGQKDDVVIGLTTSDAFPHDPHSRNIFNAFRAARKMELRSIGLFSKKTKNLLNMVDVPIQVPSEETALIQEVHLSIIHIISGLIEETITNQ